jgi:DmsE family decaheme c-type cytochrome
MMRSSHVTRSAGARQRLAAGLCLGALLVIAVPARALPPGYVGDEVCAGCHEDALSHYSATMHAKVLNQTNARTEEMRRGCEACHGPGQAHVEAGGGRGVGGEGWVSFRKDSGESAATQNAVCLGCHEGGERLFWKGSPHQSRGAPCISCHEVMTSVSPDDMLSKSNVVETCAQCHLLKRSQTFRNSHMPMRQGPLKEGWMDCSSCHNPHGTVTPKRSTPSRPTTPATLPRGQAWALPLGTRPGARELHQLSRPARHDHSVAAEDARAAAVPDLPRGHAAPLQPVFRRGPEGVRARLSALPQQHPRQQPPLRFGLHALTAV